MTNQEKAEQAMRDLLDCSNVMGSDVDVSKAISNVLSREHRTLQQAFMRSFVTQNHIEKKLIIFGKIEINVNYIKNSI